MDFRMVSTSGLIAQEENRLSGRSPDAAADLLARDSAQGPAPPRADPAVRRTGRGQPQEGQALLRLRR